MSRVFLLFLRFLLFISFLSLLFYFLFSSLALSGHTEYTQNFQNKKNFHLSLLSPSARVLPPINNSQKIIGQPVYFTLKTPRKFNSALVSFKYHYPKDFSFSSLEAGILVDNILWRYKTEPLENYFLDQIALKWDKLQEGDLMLLQKEKHYQSINDFLKSLPESSKVALYNYDLQQKYILNDYQPQANFQEINQSLRGDYQFYTYIKDEDLDFRFRFKDLNKNSSPDQITISLYHGDELIEKNSLADDGILSDTGEIKPTRFINFNLTDPKEGIYKFEIKANDDILTSQIKTKQTKLSFINKIRILSDENITLYSDSLSFQALSPTPSRSQTLIIGGAELKIDEAYKQYSLKTGGGISEINLKNKEIILSGNGVFAFNRSSLINPAFKKADKNLNLEKEGIEYILARYIPPIKQAEWNMAQVKFDLNEAYQEPGEGLTKLLKGGAYSFMLALPEADLNEKNYLEVKEIKVELEGSSLNSVL